MATFLGQNLVARKRKRNRTIRPSGAPDRVKIAIGASHTCTRTRAFKATERSEVLTSRGAKRRVRYEKEKNAFKPHFVRSLARSAPLRLRSAPLPGCGVPSGLKIIIIKTCGHDLGHDTACTRANKPSNRPHPYPQRWLHTF